MTEAALRTFNDSFFRCMADPRFVERFCLRLLNSPSAEASARVRPTVPDRLNTAFDLCIIHHVTMRVTGDYSDLSCLADRYSRRQRPELYRVWVDSLVATVAELDPRYGDEVGAAWRDAFRPAIDYMVSLY